MSQGKETEHFWLPKPPSHSPTMSLPAQPAGTKTYIEDVGGGWQRELHTIDDEGEGGQILNVVTIHKKLQREEQGPDCLIYHLRVAANCVTSGPRPESQACFWTGGGNTRAMSYVNTVGITHVGSCPIGGILGHLSISPTPKTLLLPEFPPGRD